MEPDGFDLFLSDRLKQARRKCDDLELGRNAAEQILVGHIDLAIEQALAWEAGDLKTDAGRIAHLEAEVARLGG